MARCAAALVVALALLACGGAKPAPQPPPAPEVDAGGETVDDEEAREAMLAPLVERHLDAIEEMARVVEQHLEDCPGMAAALDSFFTLNAALFEDIERAESDPDNGPVLARLHRPSRERADKLSALTADGVALCANDPAMLDVVERMPFH